jgi:septum formation protein
VCRAAGDSTAPFITFTAAQSLPSGEPSFAALHCAPMQAKLVLASGSPRRRELLAEAGVGFEVLTPDVDESAAPGEPPAVLAERLARAKADAVLERVEPGRWVLAADTVVALDGELFGKPADPGEALRMLRRLAGRTHRVFTGYALGCAGEGPLESAVEESRVTLCALSDAQIEAYVASGEPLDKAGAYAAQGEAGRFVEKIEGSRSNVIGLPLEAVLPRLRRLGIAPA